MKKYINIIENIQNKNQIIPMDKLSFGVSLNQIPEPKLLHLIISLSDGGEFGSNYYFAIKKDFQSQEELTQLKKKLSKDLNSFFSIHLNEFINNPINHFLNINDQILNNFIKAYREELHSPDDASNIIKEFFKLT